MTKQKTCYCCNEKLKKDKILINTEDLDKHNGIIGSYFYICGDCYKKK